jgi:pimeloyl-ACP methyl ester carboxylesterase
MNTSLTTHVFARKSAALWSLLALMAAGCGDSQTDPEGAEPILRPFESAACSHMLSQGSTTRCGTLQVPADRADPNSKLIEVYASIYPAKDPATATTPLIYLIGGPGSSTEAAKNLFEITDPSSPEAHYRQGFGDNRDLIVLDQRGTNNSAPGLYCSKELGPVREQAYTMKLADANTLRLTKLEECFKRLKEEGVNLSAFDTYESAADVRDLALSLGYERVNLYGASYGTRLSMTVMKEFPELVENAVIDSILPPEVNPFETQPEGAAYGLVSLWELAMDTYPDLERHFHETIAKLETAAVTVKIKRPMIDTDELAVVVTGVEYANYVFSRLREPAPDPELPGSIVKMSQSKDAQDFAPVAAVYLNTIDFLFPKEEAGINNSTAYGMFESINAAADGHYTDLEVVENNIIHYLETDAVREWGRQTFIYQNADVLGKWPVDPLPKDILQPLISDIPTLMLVGTLDAATPPPFSRSAANYLSNSQYVEILGGHALAFQTCAVDMLNEFLKDPSAEVSNTCPATVKWMDPAP